MHRAAWMTPTVRLAHSSKHNPERNRRAKPQARTPSQGHHQSGPALAPSRMLLCPPRLLDGLTPAMLSIGKLARGQADYYLEQAKGRVDHATSVESGVEDYYLGGPDAKGYWLGS